MTANDTAPACRKTPSGGARPTGRRLTQAALWLVPLAALLALAWWAYQPGLSGGFLFDDYGNLPVLGATGAVDDWATFWRYITAGQADPTGRPLALLSFLVDAQDWPADPRPFLRTNLVLHLLNGVLLALLLRALGRAHDSVRTERRPAGRESTYMPSLPAWRINLAALLGAAFWLLHPLMVSTTLYIVQREAMLPATLVLFGLLAWLHGRRRMLAGRTTTGVAWLALGLGGCTVLAFLSKANGILLPALALVLEYTVLRQGKVASRPYRLAMRVLAWPPAAFVAAYLAYQGWQGIMYGIGNHRPWTLAQRLLTEPRVLMHYLELLWLPRPFTAGLFNDFIHASTTLWHPLITLPALLAVLGLVVGAIALRRRWPAMAAAIGFYFVGQSLESSSIALELYYEHRNYLPALLMFWPLALWLCGVPQTIRARTVGHPPAWWQRLTKAGGRPLSPNAKTAAKLTLAMALIAGLAGMTHARASLWGHQHDLALSWARHSPHGARAQAFAAQADMQAGQPVRAIRRLRPALAASPHELQLALNLLDAECQAGRIRPTALEAARTALRTARQGGAMLTGWFQNKITAATQPPPRCPQLTLDTLTQLLHALQENPYLMARAGRRQELHYLLGRIALARGQGHMALVRFNRALDQDVRPGAALKQAALLGSAGYPRLGLAHLNHYEAVKDEAKPPGSGMRRVHNWVLHLQAYWIRELQRMRRTLHHDTRQGAATPRIRGADAKAASGKHQASSRPR